MDDDIRRIDPIGPSPVPPVRKVRSGTEREEFSETLREEESRNSDERSKKKEESSTPQDGSDLSIGKPEEDEAGGQMDVLA